MRPALRLAFSCTSLLLAWGCGRAAPERPVDWGSARAYLVVTPPDTTLLPVEVVGRERGVVALRLANGHVVRFDGCTLSADADGDCTAEDGTWWVFAGRADAPTRPWLEDG